MRSATNSAMPAPGDKAPNFSGTNQHGGKTSLADFKGRPVVLYFYPKDNTPGCTKQACNLRDNWSALQERGIAVVGVSADSEESHQRFADKFSLPFPLIADTDKRILNKYGAWGEKNMYGRKKMGIKRTTFLIGADGKIVHVFKRPKTADHTAEILSRLD